jgi:hypothetical protein
VTTPIAPLLAWAPRDAANRDLPERWHVPRSACPLKPMPSSVETLEKRIERRSHLRLMTETRLERYEKRTDWPLAAVALTFLGLYSVRVLAQLRGGGAESRTR